jgi:hypothetical protein
MLMMMRRPEFLMMRRPCAALRRPENKARSVPILLLVRDRYRSKAWLIKTYLKEGNKA